LEDSFEVHQDWFLQHGFWLDKMKEDQN